MERPLTPRQDKYVENIARGLDSRAPTRLAGYSDSFSKVAAHRLGKKPAVAQAVERIRTEGMKIAVYDLATAVAEAEAVCAFAKLHKNAMAYCKGTELRAKLSGLLIDRIEVVPVDLRGALERAELRIVNVTPALTQTALPPLAKQSTRWAARIAGDQNAGPVAGESETSA